MISVRETTFSGAKWGAIEKFAVQGVRFVIGLIIARMLVPSDYGMISMITVFIALGDIIVDCGFSNALIRRKEQSQADYSTIFFSNIVISATCYGILFISAPYIAEFFKMPLLKTLVRVQSLSLIINSLFSVNVAKLTIELNFKTIAKCHVLSSLGSGACGLILAYSGFGVWTLVFQSLTACTLTLIFVYVWGKWKPSLIFSRASFRSMFSYGSKLLASSLVNKIYANLSTLFIGKIYSSSALGNYDRGASLASFAPDNVNSVMQKVTFPILAKLQDDEERLIDVYRNLIKMLSIAIFFICIFIASIAKPLILLLLSAKWVGAVIFLQLFTFSVIVQHIDTINLNILYVKGRSDLVFKLEIIKKTLSTLVLLAMVPFGVIAICLARVIHSQITIVCDSYYTGKLYGYGLIAQLKDIWKYLVLSLIACAPAFALSFSGLPHIAILGISLVLCPSIYYLTLKKDTCFISLVDIVKSQIKGRS